MLTFLEVSYCNEKSPQNFGGFFFMVFIFLHYTLFNNLIQNIQMRIIPLKFNTNYYPILYGKIKTNNYLLFRCNSLFWMFRKLELTGNLNDYLLRRVRAIKKNMKKVAMKRVSVFMDQYLTHWSWVELLMNRHRFSYICERRIKDIYKFLQHRNFDYL